MNLTRLCTWVATLGPVGKAPAPGTVATIVSLPLVFWLHDVVAHQMQYLWIVIASFFISYGIISCALQTFKGQYDPQEIVIDELVGCVLTFWGISLGSKEILVGFLLFRALDISKLGLKRLEKFTGPWGILLDDVAAALVTNIVLRILFVHSVS